MEHQQETVAAVLKNLLAALKAQSLYPEGHPSLERPIKTLHTGLGGLLTVDFRVSLNLVEGVLVFGGIPFYDTEPAGRDLGEHLEKRKIGTLEFVRGISENEIKAFLKIFALTPEMLEQQGGIARALKEQNISHIKTRSPREIYYSAVDAVEEVLSQARLGRVPDAGRSISIMEEISDAVLEDRGALIGLTMIKDYDNYLFNHSVNVGVLALSLAEFMGCPREELPQVGLAGMFHDIGKTATPKEIIQKPGKLTDDEWVVMREHPVHSYEILGKMEGISDECARMVLEHHVQFNREGYPTLEDGREILPYSQVLTIADCYDAMTTLRTYQRPMTPREALEIMEANLVGKVIDPNHFDYFVKMLGIYPIGTLLRLTTNEIAVVTAVPDEDQQSPTVRVLIDPDGVRLVDSFEMDLKKDSEDEHAPAIVSTVDPLLVNIDMVEIFSSEL